MIDNRVLIDFEFNRTAEPDINLVCCSYRAITKGVPEAVQSVWLHNDRNAVEKLATVLCSYQDTHTFVAYAVTAEARSFLALGIDPMDFKWCDLYVEWLQIRYNNEGYKYGRYIKEGMDAYGRYRSHIRTSVAPSMDASENVGRDNTETGTGYAGCACALLGEKVDTARKRTVRDLIISDPEQFTADQRTEIMMYCDSDLDYLDPILDRQTEIVNEVTGYPAEMIHTWQTNRGEYSACISHIEKHGIPIDLDAIKNLSRNHWDAVNELVIALNEDYIFYELGHDRKSDMKGHWVFKYYRFAGWIEDNNLGEDWPKTDGGDYSSKSDVLKSYKGYTIIGRLRDTQKSIKNINWFRKDAVEGVKGEKGFLDYVGSDERLRTRFGIFGTQTGRNAPPAKRYPFAMSKWLRCIIKPDDGMSITECDYSNQEFVLAAFKSDDQNMMDAYNSGDPYMFFAILAGGAPEGSTKQTHPKVRDKFKGTVLGLQYGMGLLLLWAKLRADTGDPNISEDDTRVLRDMHRSTFSAFWEWIEDITDTYSLDGFLLLPDGWFLGPHCHRIPSLRNWPIQGLGACIIRRCCILAIRAGLNVITPLHDAMYIMHKTGDEHAILTLEMCMNQAVADVVPGCLIRMSTHTHDSGQVWIHEDGEVMYERMKKYLKFRRTDAETESELLELLYGKPTEKEAQYEQV